MILGAPISYALLAALATALLVAAVTDLRRREIDNWLNAAIALSAPLYWLAAGLDWVGVVFQLALALLTLVIACVLFAVRQMGGGDAKLLTALALWFVPGSFFQVIVIMGVIGGAASIAMAVSNMDRRAGEALRNAISTFAAALWVLGACELGYAAATGRSLLRSEQSELLTSPAAGWLPLIVGVVLAAILAVGLGHIVRRQRGAVEIPYGVAIAAGGLWVLAQNAQIVAAPAAA